MPLNLQNPDHVMLSPKRRGGRAIQPNNATPQTGTGGQLADSMEASFDDIRMISYIAKGTSGSVYKAKWQGMPVAVKQFHIGNDDDEATLAFHNEIHLMKHLNHVNLVRFYAVRYPLPSRPTYAAAPY